MLLEKKYRNIAVFNFLILLVITWGFYRTYIQFFPAFTGFKAVHHVHGALMLLWMLMLIVQPFLIAWKKFALHRNLGKVSYVLAPFVVLFIVIVAGVSFHKMLSANAPLPVAIGSLALNLPAAFAFAAFYILAMTHRRDRYVHMRYMIGTALLMIGPGLGRALIVYGHIPFEPAVTYVQALAALMALGLLAADFIRKQNVKPALTIFLVLLIVLAFWLTRMGVLWQFLGGGFATLFF